MVMRHAFGFYGGILPFLPYSFTEKNAQFASEKKAVSWQLGLTAGKSRPDLNRVSVIDIAILTFGTDNLR